MTHNNNNNKKSHCLNFRAIISTWNTNGIKQQTQQKSAAAFRTRTICFVFFFFLNLIILDSQPSGNEIEAYLCRAVVIVEQRNQIKTKIAVTCGIFQFQKDRHTLGYNSTANTLAAFFIYLFIFVCLGMGENFFLLTNESSLSLFLLLYT